MYIDIQELAEKLAVSVSTIRSWVRSGHLDASTYFKAGNTYRFNFEAVLNCLHGQPLKPPGPVIRSEKPAQALEVKRTSMSNVDPDLDQHISHDAEADFLTSTEEPIHPNKIDLNADSKNKNARLTVANILNTTKKHDAIRLAQKMFKEGQLQRARVIFEDILEKYPKNQRALQGLAFLPDGITENEDEEEIDGVQDVSGKKAVKTVVTGTEIGEMDVLRADYEFLVLKLSNLIQNQCHFFEDFFDDIVPADFLEALNDETAEFEGLQGYKDFDMRDQLEKFTKGLVHELYNIQKYLVPEQEKHMAEAWKTAGNLETFFSFFEEIIDLKSYKLEVEKTFWTDFQEKRDQVSTETLGELRDLIGSMYRGSALYSLLDQNYPKDVDVQKVIQLREQVFNSHFKFKPIA